MATPRRSDDLTRVAEYLAQQRRLERAAAEGQTEEPLPPTSGATLRDRERNPFRAAWRGTDPIMALRTAVGIDPAFEVETYTRRPDGGVSTSSLPWGGDTKRFPKGVSPDALMPGADFDKARAAAERRTMPAQQPIDMNGRLPFISGAPVHPSGPSASAALPTPGDPGMGNAMSQAATAWRKHGAQPPPVPAPAPAAAKKGGSAGMKRSLQVSTTSQSGPQPQLREFQPLAQLAPKELEMRLGGLPEGVAREMRKRWGLEDAQADANNRSLAVELASAGNQIGSGIAGGRYDDGLWDNQRRAARQPVADYEAQAGEERQQNEDQRRAAEDEREARAAEQAARMASEKFSYEKTRDKGQDQLARDRMAQEKTLEEARLGGAAAERGLRRKEMSLREAESTALKIAMADEKAAERRRREKEKDLQRVGEQTSKAPYGELQQALEEVDSLVPGLAYGEAPAEAPMGIGDRMARSAPFGMGNWAVSDEGQKYGQAIANLRDLVSRMRSGAVLNPGEERHYLSLLGDEVFSDPRRAAAGINAVRQGVAQKLRNAQGAYGKTGALDEYEATGATTFRAPIFSATGRRVPVVDPNGRAATLDESELAEALKDGWRRR